MYCTINVLIYTHVYKNCVLESGDMFVFKIGHIHSFDWMHGLNVVVTRSFETAYESEILSGLKSQFWFCFMQQHFNNKKNKKHR